MQGRFSLIKVKVLLVSLLDGFRDLTRAGVMSFDFNHLKCAHTAPVKTKEAGGIVGAPDLC